VFRQRRIACRFAGAKADPGLPRLQGTSIRKIAIAKYCRDGMGEFKL
jgi:hypothetical protein